MSRVSFDFYEDNYIVTGASSGMGRMTVVELANAGANVLAIARNMDRLNELKDINPDKITIASVDVCNYDEIEECIRNYVKTNGKLNGVVHAAGITDVSPIRSYNRENAHKIMDISFWAGVDLIQITSKKTMSIDGASFILFSSVASEASLKGMFAYSSAKAAVNASVKSIAKDLAKRKHRVNCIMPGWVESGMTDFLGGFSNMDDMNNRELLGFGNPEDVTGMVLFLLSDRSKWITGTSVRVDGGFLA